MTSETIRILHTADWHLGKQLHGADLTAAHRFFFDWLVETVEKQEVDLVLVSGDLFDRLNPSPDSEDLLIGTVERLRSLAQVVMITGNHDPSGRLGYGGLLESGLELRSGLRRLGEPHIVSGLAFPLVIYPVPYLYPYSAAGKLDCEPTHEAVLTETFDRARSDLRTRQQEDPRLRSVAMAHAFIRGAATSESERPLTVGGAQEVDAGIFEGFDYVALGHLHKPQRISETVRYSGSPLPLSFSEVADPGSTTELKKTVPLVELASDGSISVSELPVDQKYRFRRITGTVQEILDLPADEADAEDRVEIKPTDEQVPSDAWARLKKRFPHLLSMPSSESGVTLGGEDGAITVSVDERDTESLIEDFLKALRTQKLDPGAGQVDPEDLLDDEERALIREAVEETRAREIES